MGFVLGTIAKNGSAGINDFTEEALKDEDLRRFGDKVEMVLDPEVDAAYPRRWIGLVEIETKDGDRLVSRVDTPKGDPGNTLSREELEEKARSLAAYGGGASAGEMDRVIARSRDLEKEGDVRDLLPAGSM
jgi:2-methylcitrate dehydratase PrpD